MLAVITLIALLQLKAIKNVNPIMNNDCSCLRLDESIRTSYTYSCDLIHGCGIR